MKMMKKLLLFTLAVFLAGVTAFSQTIHDFQANTIGEVLPFETGWAAGDITVTVVDDPLSPGNNVMRSVNINNNAAPALMFTIPAGRTLADYSQLRFRGHFPTGDVGWKWIRVIAYTSVPAGTFDHTAQQGVTIGSYQRWRGPSAAWENITVNIAGSAAITGTVYLAFGFSNSGATWFADNVELVLNVPVTGITVTAPNDSILVDDGTMQMAATIDPANATNPAVTWSVSNPAIATISATGLLTAVSNGTVTVTATSVSSPTVTGTMDIAVVNQIVPVTGITVTAPNDSILVDDGTMQMVATATPANATIPAVTWSVNTPAVATISATGLLTAVTNGTVTVTATSVSSPTVTGTMVIAVVNQIIPVTGITVTSPADNITVAGGTLQMAATVVPVNATNPAVTWSVDAPTVATISATTGLLTAVANGTVIVTATSVSNPAVSGTRTITVNIPVAVEPLLFYDFENFTVGDVLPFETGWGAGDITVTVVDDPLAPETGNNVMRTVTTNWNAAPALMFRIPEGRTLADYSQLRFRGHFAVGDVGWKLISVAAYTAVPTGSFPPTVTIGSYNRARAASTAWEDIRINIAGSSAITGTVYLAFGFNNSGSTWFADNVELVFNVPVTGITVTSPADSIKVAGGTLQMAATAAPVDATNPAVTWSVDVPAVATISATGLLTAVSNGTVVVTGRSVANPTVSGTKTIIVNYPAPTGITVTAPNDSILVDNGTLLMAASVLPAGSDQRVIWSASNPAIATISAAGLLTAVNNGTVTVTATSVANSAITGTMDIAVVNQVIPVTGITVASPADTIKVAGGTLQMAASVLPVNATNVAITWSVDAPAVATISETGLLTAVANGTVIVTATSVSDPAVSRTITITVAIAPPVNVDDFTATTFALYPVPVETQLFISSSVAIERVEVLSIVGRTLISATLSGGNAVDVSALPAGTYIVRVLKVNGDVEVRTIIKN